MPRPSPLASQVTPDPKDARPLSKRPAGYLLAFLGGALAVPFGFFISPLVLLALNKLMPAKDGTHPNRFARWALIGCIFVPVNLVALSVAGAKIVDSDVKDCNSGAKDACDRLVGNESAYDRITNPAFSSMVKENEAAKDKERLARLEQQKNEAESREARQQQEANERAARQKQEAEASQQARLEEVNKKLQARLAKQIARPFLMLNEETYQAQYGEPWPLTVKAGKLYCAGSKADPQVIFETEGTVYGVNGNAAGRTDGPSLWYGKTEIKSLKYGNMNEIRKSHPDGPMYGLMPTSTMIQEGLKLCPEK